MTEVLAGTPGLDAPCPADCGEARLCGSCVYVTCPVHDPEHFLSDSCIGVAHAECHDQSCRDPECWL